MPEPLSSVQLDFVDSLPRTLKGHENIFTIIDYSTKYLHTLRFLSLGIVKQVTSEWHSPVTLAPRPDGSTSLSVDYRRVSLVVFPSQESMTDWKP